MTEMDETFKSPSATDVSSDETESPNVTTNFDNLSDEIMLKILNLLDTRSLGRCSQVNKRFRTLAQDPFVYTSLDLGKYYESVNDTILNNLAPRCQGLRRLFMTNCDRNISPETFKNFLSVCGNSLIDLGLRFSHFVDDSIMQEIPLICRNLKKLDLYSCKVTNIGFNSLTALNTLEDFAIFGPDIDQAILMRIIQKNPKLRHLDLCHLHYTDVDEIATVIADSCPDLESLAWPCTNISHRGLEDLARCTNLRHLNIASCSNVFSSNHDPNPQKALKRLFMSCIHLKTVNLAMMVYCTDDDLEPLLSCPIEELNLTEAKYLTTDMCSRFFVSWPRLRKINLNMCKKISPTDVQEWQSQYPHVTITYKPWRSRLRKCYR